MFPVRYATESDVPALCKLNVLGFQNRRSRAAIFPSSDLITLQDFKELNSMKQLSNPEIHVVLTTDPATDLVVSYARWLIPDSLGFHQHKCVLSQRGASLAAAADSPMEYAPRPINEELYIANRLLYANIRKKHVTGRDIVLDLLATLPSHQGQGIGSLLLEWGIERADKLQTRIYLEATPEGVPLYLRNGWRAIEDVGLNLEPYGGSGTEIFTVMTREPVLHNSNKD